MVTNEKLTADTKVPVIDVTNLQEANIHKRKSQRELVKDFLGLEFEIDAGKGTITNYHHFPYSKDDTHRFDTDRLKTLSKIGDLLKNAVYIDKHEDVKGTNTRFIDFFIPIMDGKKIYVYLIAAQERQPNSGKFVIGKADFYDYIKKDPIQAVSKTGLPEMQATTQTGSLVISIVDMLRDVKDRNGKNYVDANGNLNYEPGVLKSYNQEDLGATSWDAAGRATITLIQKANASTLIHESGHVFLEALWTDIQKGITTEQEIKEFEA